MTDHDERRIEYVNLKKLRADPRNPKAHAEEAISASVDRFGFLEPIVVDSRTGYISSGHGRTSTLTRMRVEGQAPPRGVRVNGKGEWLVPVVHWRSDNDYESGAALIAVNRAGELGGWADESLLSLLHELEDSADGIGFTPDDVEDLEKVVATAIASAAPALGDVDDVPALRKEARSVRGDVWICGTHRVVCGDATDPEAYAALLEGATADVMWTDPPYGVDYVGGDTTLSRAERAAAGGVAISNDGALEVADLLAAALPHMVAALRPGAAVYVAHADAFRTVVQPLLEQAGISYRQTLIWLKDRLVPGRSDYQHIYEPIAYGFTPGKGLGRLGRGGKRWHGNDAQRSVIEVPRPGRSKEHPTMKPVDLIAAMLRNSARAGHVILDPFGGSGSTLIAAETLGMHARVIELDPIYVDVIVDRWERLTGKKAQRAPMEGFTA